MEHLAQQTISDKDPREGVGLDTLVIRLDLRGRAAALWGGCGRLIADQCPGWVSFKDKANAWIAWNRRLGVRLAAPYSDRRSLHLSLEVSRLARAAREPWRVAPINTDKVSGQRALDLVFTVLEDLRAAVGDAAPWQREELEPIRLDPCADFLWTGSLSALKSPPLVRRRQVRDARTFERVTDLDLEIDDKGPRSFAHYRCGGSADRHREVTRIYDRGELHPRARDLRGVVRYEAEHGRETRGTAKRPLELAFMEDNAGCEQIAGVRAWREEPIDLLDACDPALWVAILAERLREQGLPPGASGGFVTVRDFWLALRAAENVNENDAAFYALAMSGDLPREQGPSGEAFRRKIRDVKKRVEQKTKIRWIPEKEKDSPSEKIWTILWATPLDVPSLERFERVEALSRLLALDPDFHHGPIPELELELRSTDEDRTGDLGIFTFGFEDEEDTVFSPRQGAPW